MNASSLSKNSGKIPVAKSRANRYLNYKPVREDITVPKEPMFRYETNSFGYYIYKYFLPCVLALTYLTITVFNLMTYGFQNFSGAVSIFLTPIQAASIVLLPLSIVFVSRPLAHLIVCEEGMFVRSHWGRWFVPWKFLRSYHEARFARPWLVALSFYNSRGSRRKFYAIASMESENTSKEILNFIYKVRHEEGAESADSLVST